MARGLVEGLGRDGWSVEFHRLDGDHWEALVVCPWRAGQVVALGSSRVSAISRAHVESVRRLGLVDGGTGVPSPPIHRDSALIQIPENKCLISGPEFQIATSLLEII